MTLTNNSLLSFKTPLLGLVLMTAYAAVSVYSTYPPLSCVSGDKGNKWALVYFGVFSGHHPDINYKHNIRHHSGLVDGLHASFSHCEMGCLGLMEITHTPRMPSRSGPPLPWTTISENVKGKH
jgi:hypothetical protein